LLQMSFELFLVKQRIIYLMDECLKFRVFAFDLIERYVLNMKFTYNNWPKIDVLWYILYFYEKILSSLIIFSVTPRNYPSFSLGATSVN
jgi:hypothetical protein